MTSARKAANNFRVDVPRLTMEGGEEQAGPRRLVLINNVVGMTRRGTIWTKSSRGGLAKRFRAEGRGRKRRKEGREDGGDGDGDGDGNDDDVVDDDDDDRAKGDEEKEARAREAD